MLAALREELAREALFVVRVVNQSALDARGVHLQLGDLLPGARSALVVGDGGGEFFARFTDSLTAAVNRGAAGSASAAPLDDYTARVIPAAVARVAGQQPFRVLFPFSREPVLPVQKVGEAAGLPPAGPLGVQVHPRFGAWWAYRALVVLGAQLPLEPPLTPPCQSCPAPCVSLCPAGAAQPQGLAVLECAGHRLRNPGCFHSCAARVGCIAGPEHRYPDAQLAFHMAHSLGLIRTHLGSSSNAQAGGPASSDR